MSSSISIAQTLCVLRETLNRLGITDLILIGQGQNTLPKQKKALHHDLMECLVFNSEIMI